MAAAGDGLGPPWRIDTHQHLIPPAYRRALEQRGGAQGWRIPDWDPAAAIRMMDAEGIATGVLSVSAPGVSWGGDAGQAPALARELAREVNDYGAELVKDRPDRWGLFAVLPLPDVDGALAEAARALDELGADGVVLMSNAGGRYLGDRALEPLWQELDARAAVVFVHPTAPALEALEGMPSNLLDFPFDTTRTAVHMVVHGVLDRHPRLKVVLAHGGGFLPYAAHRFTGAAADPTGAERVLADLERFHLDTALTSSPSGMPSLLAFADPTRITFGTDFPAPDASRFTAWLDEHPLDPWQRHAIDRGNAEVLLPRLARPALR